MKAKKIVLWVANGALAVYLVLAVTAFNRPDESRDICTRVVVDVADANAGGFIDGKEVSRRLTEAGLYPLHRPMSEVSARGIEERLLNSSFVRTANCTKTIDGTVRIEITQRTPVIRVMSDSGDDYYLDDQSSIMPGKNYTSDLIVATGHISRTVATRQIAPMGLAILQNDKWRSLIEQINVLPDMSVEIVPRVGNHIVCLGKLPDAKGYWNREEQIKAFVDRKLGRLMKFYRYGLSQAGWNRYDYISVEFDNQIICHKDPAFERLMLKATQEAQPEPAATPAQPNAAANQPAKESKQPATPAPQGQTKPAKKEPSATRSAPATSPSKQNDSEKKAKRRRDSAQTAA